MSIFDIIDPDLRYARTTTQVWAEMTRDLADELIVPLNVTDYAVAMNRFMITAYQAFEEDLAEQNITLGYILFIALWMVQGSLSAS